MDSAQSTDPNAEDTGSTATVQSKLPLGPQPTSRWECPARYMTNHKHHDGRPLCKYCECWNPAPFPNRTLPIQPPRPFISSIPTNSAISYDGYNLPPPPNSFINQGSGSVYDVNPLLSILFYI